MKNHKILILMPYFGQWPFWFELFLASCELNPSIDWLLISDCGEPEYLPANVAYKSLNFEEYKKLVSTKIGVNFLNANAYKICDVRPMFGLIHEEDIQGYDFWAFGDLDLVYASNLRDVFNSEILERYKLISNHATRISGHLTFVKNDQQMRYVFNKIPNWKEKVTADYHSSLDEKGFSKLFVKHKNFPQWLRKLTNNFYPLAKQSLFRETYTTPNGCIRWEDDSFEFPKVWYWQDGRIWNDLNASPDCPYFHFAVWKKENWRGDVLENIRYVKGAIYEFTENGIRMLAND